MKSLVLLPSEVVDLAASMHSLGYPSAETAARCGIDEDQVQQLALALGPTTLYDRRVVDSGATPAVAREFHQLLQLEPEPADIPDALEKAQKAKIPMLMMGGYPPIGTKTLKSQYWILRMIENGVPVAAAFGSLGFDRAMAHSWVAEDKDFGAAVVRQTVAYGQRFLGKVEKAADSDWKAASWLLEKHPHSRASFSATGTEGEERPTLNVVLQFQRGDV